MNRLFLAAVAAAMAVLLPLPAFACTPLPAKNWEGTIQLANHLSVSANDFVVNSCVFHDDRLNGFDAIAFDVSSHAGLAAAARWSTTHPTGPDQVNGQFYTANCDGISGTGWNQMAAGADVLFTIPSSAKWMVVTPNTIAPSKDIVVKISSAGRKCP